MTYDLLAVGVGRTLAYTSFNLPKTVTMAAISQSYAYDAEHQRIVMTEGSANTTTYINPRWDVGTHFEKEKKGNIDEYKHYIYAGGRPVAMYVVKRDNGTGINSTYTRYLHTDHLGSVDTITSETGAIVERLSYDAWGKRRNANGTDAATQLTSNITHHGYTGHEMLDSIGLINMNGRWYDPTVGRMMQADPSIQSPLDLQNYNRYSYVDNNPLSFTDPSGYKKFWKKSWAKKGWMAIRGATKFVVGAVVLYLGWEDPTGFFQSAGLALMASGACEMKWSCKPKDGGLNKVGVTVPTDAPAKSQPIGSSGGSSSAGGRSGGGTNNSTTPVAYDQYGNAIDTSNMYANSGMITTDIPQWDLRWTKNLIRGLSMAMSVLAAPMDIVLGLAIPSELGNDELVYRVWGGDAREFGRSWSPVDPRTAQDYRLEAGLPANNAGTMMSTGRVLNWSGVIAMPAEPYNGMGGGWPEYRFPSYPAPVVIIDRISINPPF